MDEVQLKILWTMLFGTLSLLGFVIYGEWYTLSDCKGSKFGGRRFDTAFKDETSFFAHSSLHIIHLRLTLYLCLP